MRDIEEIVHECPGVKDVVADFASGFIVVWVSLQRANHLTEADVLHFCQQHCPQNWIPNQIHILPELPYSKSGKILKS